MESAKSIVAGRCLCGAHRFRLEGPLELMHHCHCGYCRKTHGSAYATLVGVAPERFHWEARGEAGSYESSPGVHRDFCKTCGSPLPGGSGEPALFVPAGCLDGDFGERSGAHIFAASKLPWLELDDGVPAFDEYPPGFDAPTFETRASADPAGGVRGSCLCGDVRYRIEGPAITARHCHCQRCRRARGAAHASNLIVAAENLVFTAGEERRRDYELPEARWFTQSFCDRCGSAVPRVDGERKIAIVPLGGLDDPPPMAPQEHIWVGSMAPWHTISDSLPQHQEGPPPS